MEPTPEGALSGTPYPPLIRTLLWQRGVHSVSDAADFLFESNPPEHDALLLPELEAALFRIKSGIEAGERFAVFGDFDADGLTATAILTESLTELGANVFAHIPNRFTDGYGLSEGAVDMLHKQGARVIITADCGTGSVREVERARELGMDVIVLDHHLAPDELPGTVATINPKREDCRYPDTELASVGLAFKLCEALHHLLGRSFDPSRYLDLVALGTVADMAPLRGENRWLVSRGLAALRGTARPGLLALMEVSGLMPGSADAEAIGYVLGPRLNAAGRISNGRLALDLLLCREKAAATRLAEELNALNQERQRRTAAAMDLAGLLLADELEAPLLFVGHPDISSGIVGLVAGRLAEQHGRPAIVYETGETLSRGSARSIEGFDITAALRSEGHRFVQFGGHRQAAGFTAETGRLPDIKEALLALAADQLAGVDHSPTIRIDAELPVRLLGGEEIRWLSKLAPFGQTNPEPTFLSRGVRVAESKVMGADGAHLRLKLKDGPVVWPGIAFGFGELSPGPGSVLDVVYSLKAERGTEGALELQVKDFAPAGGPSG